jgi:hypothetical protein
VQPGEFQIIEKKKLHDECGFMLDHTTQYVNEFKKFQNQSFGINQVKINRKNKILQL